MPPSFNRIIWDDPYRLVLEEVWEDALRVSGINGDVVRAVALTPERDAIRELTFKATLLGDELQVRRSDRWSNGNKPWIIPVFGARFEHRSETYNNGAARLIDVLGLRRAQGGLFLGIRPLQANGSATRVRGELRLSNFWKTYRPVGSWSTREH